MSNNPSMHEPADIRELSSAEIDAVTGGGFWEVVSGVLISIGSLILVSTAAIAISELFGPEVSG